MSGVGASGPRLAGELQRHVCRRGVNASASIYVDDRTHKLHRPRLRSVEHSNKLVHLAVSSRYEGVGNRSKLIEDNNKKNGCVGQLGKEGTPEAGRSRSRMICH